MQESWMHMNLSPTPQLVFGSFAVRQKSAQPALDACNTAIGHQSHIFLVAFRLWTDQFNTPFQQPFAKRITVVLLIDYDADSIFSRLTTSIHFVSCPPLLFPTSGPFFGPGKTASSKLFLPSLTSLAGSVLKGT